MATAQDNVGRKGADVIQGHGAAPRYDDTGSNDEKLSSGKIEDARTTSVRPGGLQPPEFLLNLTPEQRADLEKKLKRKIDVRLLPAVIIMYILNYIDRYVRYGSARRGF